MKTASVRDLRNHFPRVARWLRAGEEVHITFRGEEMYKLTLSGKKKPARKPKFEAEAHQKWLKETYGGKTLKGNSVLLMREGSKW